MPTIIPHDPSLVLGNIVSPEKLDKLQKISQLQAPVDIARTHLNSLISLKRSIETTIRELMDMSIPADDLIAQCRVIEGEIKVAVANFEKVTAEAESAIKPIRESMLSIVDDWESPVDHNKSRVTRTPVSSDSLKISCQYFANDENAKSAGTFGSMVDAFISNSLSGLNDEMVSPAKTAVQTQLSDMLQSAQVAGTIVIAAPFTHRSAAAFSPLTLDIDKAIRVWNKLFPGDMLKTDDLSDMIRVAQSQSQATAGQSFHILSGATYGSCFIGMVHVLNGESRTTESMHSLAASIQAHFDLDMWFSGNYEGKIDVAQNAKKMLSKYGISSPCSFVSMAAVPSIRSNQARQAAVAQLSGLAVAEPVKVSASKEDRSLINQVVDAGSMCDALDDFMQKCVEGNAGTPVYFYLKPFSRSQLAQLWLAKNYPNKYQAIDQG